MAKRRTRGLRPEERALWESYAAGVRPTLPKQQTKEPSAPLPPTRPVVQSKELSAAPISEFRIGQRATDARQSVAVSRAPGAWDGPVRMDQKAFGKMKKGRMHPDARIDLHGKTVEEAHGALIAFILSRQARGDRLVLVITGKGRGDGPAPVERGILRRQVPHWLSLPPLAQVVLDVSPAHRRHGGEGAFYVYLKRLR